MARLKSSSFAMSPNIPFRPQIEVVRNTGKEVVAGVCRRYGEFIHETIVRREHKVKDNLMDNFRDPKDIEVDKPEVSRRHFLGMAGAGAAVIHSSLASAQSH